MTGPQAQILGKLRDKGVPILQQGTEEGLDPTKGNLTILLGHCDSKKMLDALGLIKNVNTVVQADLRQLIGITQDLHARIKTPSAPHRRVLRQKHGMRVRRTAIFPQGSKQQEILQTLRTAGAKIIKSGEDPVTSEFKVAVQQPTGQIDSIIEAFRGNYRPLDVFHLTAPVPEVEDAAEYIRSPDIAPHVEHFRISGTRSSLHSSVDGK